MTIDNRETICLDAEEKETWKHMHSILQKIYYEVEDDEIKDISIRIDDYMEMLERYFY
jgi:hypothetical protein